MVLDAQREIWIDLDQRERKGEKLGLEIRLRVKTKKRASEKREQSECKFRLIVRLRNTCQVSTAYIR